MSKLTNVIIGVTLVAGMAMVTAGVANVLSAPTPPPPDTATVWRPVDAVPLHEVIPMENVVIPSSATIRVQIPNIGFDSYDFLGQDVAIGEWTQRMDDARNGTVRPPGISSIVQSSASKSECDGLAGTDSTNPFCIYAHSWITAAPFNHLYELHIGDSVAVTTHTGKICYNVSYSEAIPKGEFDTTLVSVKSTADGWLVTCDRPAGYSENAATVNNRLVGLTLNQMATNTGSC